jgi:ABC-type nickel/cobalt efflux system permease component RcnA
MPAPWSICGARLVALLAVPLLWAMLAMPAAAQQLATWASLAPSVEPYDDPFADMPFEQLEALRIIARADMAAAAGQLDEAQAQAAKQARLRAEEAGLNVDALFAQRELIMQRREEAALGVTTTHLDKIVVMDGYALPLRAEEGRVVEFLLVPWVGACVHTPPPAANQIVHVDYPEGFEAVSLFTPIRLKGRLTHRPAEHDLFLVDGARRVAASYAMDQAAIGGTPGEIVAADTAADDLSWFAAAQARITDIFTTAMTNMEQGRSVGTVGIALLFAFAYGALHTLGPGHGKAVVVSYFVGAGGSMRRGLVMGMRIAAMHVLSAVVVVFLLDFAVRQATGAAPSDYRLIRLGSYALIVAIGAVMLWRALAALRTQRVIEAEAHAHHHYDVHHHHHDAHAGCAACAAAHAGSKGGGWIAAAVGVVPCTGALIVMLFGLANDLVVPAVMMVVAISAGMALAMSAIGVAAILGRNWTEARVASTPERRIRFEAGARIAGAACVLFIGTTLFAVTFAQTPATESRQQAAVAPPAQTAATAIAN